ncbi:fructosamine kinase [Prolixibacteraceae bacterium JC049]|nr:fructosamine kinase [Prolixibacteraceae bacterium JC049]
MERAIHHLIEEKLNDRIIGKQMVGGGCIAQTNVLKMESGKHYFLKSGFSDSMFRKEANGLNELAKPNVIRVPQVVLADDEFLLLEHIQQGVRKANFYEELGKQLANMHRYTAENYGFYEDNFIGATAQINTTDRKTAGSWMDFFWENRLLFQYRLTEKNGHASVRLKQAFIKLEKLIATIIGDSAEEPTLMHGDLWGGNYMHDENGNPVLFDPAVYYGHREADLAMTSLFGGFTLEFYQAYQKEFPLKEGWEFREGIYQLYHVLNHVNLFGTSYLSQAEFLAGRYG